MSHNLCTSTLHTFTKFNVIKIWTSVHCVCLRCTKIILDKKKYHNFYNSTLYTQQTIKLILFFSLSHFFPSLFLGLAFTTGKGTRAIENFLI